MVTNCVFSPYPATYATVCWLALLPNSAPVDVHSRDRHQQFVWLAISPRAFIEDGLAAMHHFRGVFSQREGGLSWHSSQRGTAGAVQ